VTKPIILECTHICLRSLSVISQISGHDVAGSMAVKQLRYLLPLGVFTFQGPTKSTCTISDGIASATFTGNLPYCFFLKLLN
jgi:hypothetical protein